MTPTDPPLAAERRGPNPDPRYDRDPREPVADEPPVDDPAPPVPEPSVDEPNDNPTTDEPERRDPQPREPAWRDPDPGPGRHVTRGASVDSPPPVC